MKFSEFLRLVYGTMMGTSTQYVKSTNRFLFPMTQAEIGEDALVFVGGSCNSIYLIKQNVLINPGCSRAAEYVHRELNEKFDLNGLTIICTQPMPNFSEGTRLYVDASSVLCGTTLKSDLRCEVVRQSRQLDELELEVLENSYSERDLVVHAWNGRLLMTGAMFYNSIHPPFYPRLGWNYSKYLAAVQRFNQSQAEVVIPGEGAISSREDIQKYVDYLSALNDSTVEFSFCRENYDWSEIIGFTSLEENFDLIRHKDETHSTF